MSSTTTSHIPVLEKEVIEYLNIRPGGIYIDATLGGGGHSSSILRRAGREGIVLGIDKNPEAIALGEQLQKEARENDWGKLDLKQGNFADIVAHAASCQIEACDGVLFDIGLSSDLLYSQKGFSVYDETSLDMRFGGEGEITAQDIVNHSDEADLVFMFSHFGEEPYSKTIARAIVAQRERTPFSTAADLSSVIKYAIPKKAVEKGKHPARRVFQALRIVVNQEFASLQKGLDGAISLLRPGGRIVVISFHSLEDRMVKHIFKRASGICTCFLPRELCRCETGKTIKVLTGKPVLPGPDEIQTNHRAHSARLRAARKI